MPNTPRSTDELLREHREALAFHEAEAHKHRGAIEALGGKPEAAKPAQVAGTSACCCVVMSLLGRTEWACTEHGLMRLPPKPQPLIPFAPPIFPMPNPADVPPLVPGGPWPGIGPFTPTWTAPHGGQCACSQCCPPMWTVSITGGPSPIAPQWSWSGTVDGAAALFAFAEAGGEPGDFQCALGMPPAIPIFPKLGTFGPGPSMPPSDIRYGRS